MLEFEFREKEASEAKAAKVGKSVLLTVSKSAAPPASPALASPSPPPKAVEAFAPAERVAAAPTPTVVRPQTNGTEAMADCILCKRSLGGCCWCVRAQ